MRPRQPGIGVPASFSVGREHIVMLREGKLENRGEEAGFDARVRDGPCCSMHGDVPTVRRLDVD